MITQAIDPRYFDLQARRIRAQASAVLTKWGLLPRFKRWRLTQDPGTGMIVLFGILNNRYIAAYTSIPFGDYFDPRLLHDLETELQVQVVSCNSDGLRYAFILDRGTLSKLPTHIDFPFLDGDRLFVRVVYNDQSAPEVAEPQVIPAPPMAANLVDDLTLVRKGVGAFLKVLDDVKLREDAAQRLSAQNLPDIVVIDPEEFTKRVVEHEADRQRSNRISRLWRKFNKSAQ